MKSKTLVAIAAVFILAGCARWAHLDGSAARLDQISKAKIVCEYDAKLLALQARQLAKDTAKLQASSSAKKESLEAEYQQEAKKVYAKLNACMKDQGLKKIG